MLERVRRAVAAQPIAGLDVTLTAGLALASGDRSAAALYLAADRALYAAKAQGRDRVLSEPAPIA